MVEATVLDAPNSVEGPLPVDLQISMGIPPAGASPDRIASALLHRTREAAAAAVAQPVGSGERLRSAFEEIAAAAEKHDAHLLAEDETGFLASYRNLDLSSQCLFLRLLLRRGPLFRVASLAYQEVVDSRAAAAVLALAGLAVVLAADGMDSNSQGGVRGSSGGEWSWREVADVATVPELASAISTVDPGAKLSGSTRPQLLAAAAARATSPGGAAVMLRALLSVAGPLVGIHPRAAEVAGRLQRLYFLQEGQDLGQVRRGGIFSCVD
jgi:fanconi-associated nuclease 1